MARRQDAQNRIERLQVETTVGQYFFQDLYNREVYFEDFDDKSSNYLKLDFDPAFVFNSGRNLIGIRGNALTLELNSEILVEALDANGQLLKTQVYAIGDEIDTKVISIDIAPNTPPGDCIVTIIGTASEAPDGTPIPPVYQGVPNFRWTRTFTCKPDSSNKSPIIYGLNKPVIKINELKKPFFELQYNQELSGSNDANTWSGNVTSSYILSSDGFGADKNTDSKVSYRKSGDKYYITAQPATPPLLDFGGFTRDMEGGILIVRDPQSPRPSSINGYNASPVYAPEEEGDGLFENTVFTNNEASFVTGAYVTTILDVISPFEIRVSTPHTTVQGLTAGQYQNFEHFEFTDSDFELMWSQMPVSYSANPTGSNGTPLNTSYAHVTFNNLEPLTGDVTRVKCYMKNHQAPFDWMLASDNAVEANELLYRRDFQKLRFPIGDFTQYGVAVNGTASLQSYWTASGVGTTNPSIGIYKQTEANDAVPVQDCVVIGDNDQALQLDGTAYWWFQPETSSTASFYQDQWYELSFKAVSQKTQIPSFTNAYDNAIEEPKLTVYMSGSAFTDGGDDYGKFIGLIEDTAVKKKHVDQDSLNQEKEIGRKFIFKADGTEGGAPKFKIDSGVWYLWDISVKPWDRRGFTPGDWDVVFQTIKCNVGIYDSLDFRFEFYNDYGDIANYTAVINNVPWENEYTATFTNVVANTVSGSSGSFGAITVGNGPNTFNGPVNFNSNITMSGNGILGNDCNDEWIISGSVYLPCLTEVSKSKIVTYDETNGRLYVTSSILGSGGGGDNLGNHRASQSLKMESQSILFQETEMVKYYQNNAYSGHYAYHGMTPVSGFDSGTWMIGKGRTGNHGGGQNQNDQYLMMHSDGLLAAFGSYQNNNSERSLNKAGAGFTFWTNNTFRMQISRSGDWRYANLKNADTLYSLKYNKSNGEITYYEDVLSEANDCLFSGKLTNKQANDPSDAVHHFDVNHGAAAGNEVSSYAYIPCATTIGGPKGNPSAGNPGQNNFWCLGEMSDGAMFQVNSFNSLDCPVTGGPVNNPVYPQGGVAYAAIFVKRADPSNGNMAAQFQCHQAGAGHGIKVQTSTIPKRPIQGFFGLYKGFAPSMNCYDQPTDALGNSVNALHFGQDADTVDGTSCGIPNAFYAVWEHCELDTNGHDSTHFAGGVRKDAYNYKTQVVYDTVSDRRLKQNIKDTIWGLDDILKIQVRDYEWKATPVSEGGRITTGFVAQEIKQIFPQIVHGNEGSLDGEEKLDGTPLVVDYNELIPILTKAIQDQSKIIERLESRIEKLENR